MARKLAAGELTTTWFERHGSTPVTELPDDWPDDYRRLVKRRIELIENDPNIRLIEQPRSASITPTCKNAWAAATSRGWCRSWPG